MKKIDASIILTCLNEAEIVMEAVKKITAVLNLTPFSFEFVIVDDGSNSENITLLEKLITKGGNFRLVKHRRNIGRGGSVIDGIKESQGLAVGYIDPDLEISPFYLPQFISEIKQGNDVVSAVREYEFKAADFGRILASRAYVALVKFLLKLPLRDTEAGLKFFNKSKIEKIIPKIREKGWFFDTEVLYRSFFENLKIKEIPVAVVKRSDKISTVRVLPDTIYYLKTLIKFWQNFGK